MPSTETNCISIVTETYIPEVNGVANTLSYIAEGLQQRGYYTQIIRPKQSRKDGDSYTLTEQQLTVSGLPIPGYKELKFGLPCKRTLLALWRARRPRAIYVATEGPLGRSAVQAARKLNIPVLSGFHTNFQSYSNFYGVGWLEKIILAYLKQFHNRTKGTLVPTQKQKAILESKGFKHVDVMARGVNCELFNPSQRSEQLRSRWGVDKHETVLIYVGRVAAEKNIELVMGAYEEALKAVPDIKLVVVGDGPMRKSLEQRYPNVIFAGMKKGNDLAEHYASGDVFIFPSKTETFGNVVTEAMASRLSIVSFDDAAAQEHLEHELSAILVPLNRPNEVFTQEVARLAQEPSLIERTRELAYQKALSISWEAVIDTFIQSLLGPDVIIDKGDDHERSKDSIGLVR